MSSSDDERTTPDWWRGLTQAAPSDERGMAGESDAQEAPTMQPVPRAQNAIQRTPFDEHLFNRGLPAAPGVAAFFTVATAHSFPVCGFRRDLV